MASVRVRGRFISAESANPTPSAPEITAPLARMNMLEPDQKASPTEMPAPTRNIRLIALGALPRTTRTSASRSGTHDATASATSTDVCLDTTR